MTSTIASRPGYWTHFSVALLLVGLADFLFFDQPVGITMFLFGIVLAAAIVVLHPTAFRSAALVLKVGVLLAALLPLAENTSLLSLSIAFVALSAFALSVAGRLRLGTARIARQSMAFFVAAPFRFLRDFFMWRKAAKRMGGKRIRFAAVAVWLMPLGLGAIFLALFRAANPVIEYWLSLIDLIALLELIEVARIVFWLIMLAAVWAFLRPRLPRFLSRLPGRASPGLAAVPPAIDPKAAAAIEDLIFGKAAILRALIVFNLMFAAQTLLDAAYLWGGVALPDGLTYAAYAHRGAYPLIVTALLAAVFVLAAMRPGSATSGDSLIRRLVYLFVAQNIVLVISSILRLDLYVSIYSLTYWRIAAFIWMGLVAGGLALIIARIALRKSSEWLLSANLLTLSATLYACSFVNFPGLIANFNVEHSFEMTGQGVPLDSWYLQVLGPDAFRAFDRFLDHQCRNGAIECRNLSILRERDEAGFRRRQENWRAGTFRDWRLRRYLETRAASQPPAAPDPHMPGR